MIKKFKDQPIFLKISIALFAIIMALVVMLSIISLVFYAKRSSKWFYQESELAANSALEILQTHYEVITRRFVSIFANDDFAKLLLRQQDDTSTVYLRQKDIQSYLADLQVSDSIIDCVMAVSPKTGDIFSYNWSTGSYKDNLLTSEDFDMISGITYLTKRISPLHKSVTTIPIVYPLSTDYKDFVTITNNIDYTDIYIIVYIDYSKLKAEIDMPDVEYRNTDMCDLYLFSQKKILLNEDDETDSEYIYSMLKNISGDDDVITSSYSYYDENNYWFLAPIKKARILVLYHTSPTSFMSIIGINTYTVLIFLALLAVFLAAVSLLLSRYITKPIQIQAAIVKEIENGSYTQKREFKTNDEIGTLNKAINQMYDTIQSQIERIKTEESEKYKAQTLRTAEQVNPHFLYNTLDAIQSEVQKGNSKNAANLIQYLSEYMRIGLSYGDEQITVSQEIRHANAYIHLMEQRFGKDINFIYQISPGAENILIPKTILQPLLENSIRHGFGIDSEGIPVSQPTIEIIINLSSQILTLEVSDNGSGFDPAKTAAIMLEGKDEQQRHIGLFNVYYRIITSYGKDNVEPLVDSIPYYRNSIIFKISLPQE